MGWVEISSYCYRGINQLNVVASAVLEARDGEESGSKVSDGEKGEEGELEHENNLDCNQLASVVAHEK